MNEMIRADLEATLHTLEALKEKIKESENNITDAILKYDDSVDDEVLEASKIDRAIAKNLVKCAKINKMANDISFTSYAIKSEIERNTKKK